MKIKKIILLCLALIMAAGIIASAAPSPWAYEHVNYAISQNLVPLNMQNNFTQSTTRAEFCALAVALFESKQGEITGRVTFTDTDDVNVQKMAYLGIVTGIGGGLFNPNAPITREQAAVLLSRLSEAMGYHFPRAREGQTAGFADSASISPWAVDSVIGAGLVGIMSGVGSNYFDPQGQFTREQSIVSMMRLRDKIIMINTHYTPTPEGPGPITHTPLPFEVGNVAIFAEGALHAPFEHFAHGVAIVGGHQMSVSGIMFSFEAAMAELTAIMYSQDFDIVIIVGRSEH